MKLFSTTLVALLVTVIAILTLGGITRLTDSGLSITEWKPLVGAVPPLSHQAWEELFTKYQGIEQYKQLNQGMTLSEFKFIFWWEWIHRFVARVAGIIYLVGAFLLYRSLHPNKTPRLVKKYLAIGGLILAQATIGWFMVKSGFNQTYVSPFMLTWHFVTAELILILIVSCLIDTRVMGTFTHSRHLGGVVLFIGVYLQTLFGGLTAGLKGAFAYNQWPLMGDSWLPDEWLNAIQLTDIGFLVGPTQFVHRLVAYLLLAYVAYSFLKHNYAPLFKQIVGLLISVQVLLGIVTLLIPHNYYPELAAHYAPFYPCVIGSILALFTVKTKNHLSFIGAIILLSYSFLITFLTLKVTFALLHQLVGIGLLVTTSVGIYKKDKKIST